MKGTDQSECEFVLERERENSARTNTGTQAPSSGTAEETVCFSVCMLFLFPQVPGSLISFTIILFNQPLMMMDLT